MTAAQTVALILLGAILLGAIAAALYEAAGRYIDRHVEAAFNDHAYDAIALTQPITGLPCFDATLGSLPATEAGARVRAALIASVGDECEDWLRGQS